MIRAKILETKEKIMNEASIVEGMLEKAVAGISARDRELFLSLINDEAPKVYILEKEVCAIVTRIIARYHPEAKELRTLLSIFRMAADLVRITGLIINICESTINLIDDPVIRDCSSISEMAHITKNMLRDSISAFVREDTGLSEDVCCRDDKVDDMNYNNYKEMLDDMMEDNSKVLPSMHLLRISHNFERIADISTDIANETEFITDGKTLLIH